MSVTYRSQLPSVPDQHKWGQRTWGAVAKNPHARRQRRLLKGTAAGLSLFWDRLVANGRNRG